MTLLSPGSGTASLDAHGSRAAKRHLHRRPGQGEREQDDAGADGGAAPQGTDWLALGVGHSQRLVEAQVPGQQPDETVDPADHDLATSNLGDAIDLEALCLEAVAQRPLGKVREMARVIEMKPTVAEEARLQAVRVGDGHHEGPALAQQAGGLADRNPW